jgi:hypothetical protein
VKLQSRTAALSARFGGEAVPALHSYALIALALDGMEVEALDEDLGRLSGELLTWAKKNDVIDAALVLIAKDGDTILTSDPGDIQPLARAASRMVSLIAV